MPTLRTGPMIGLLTQCALCAVLGATVGLSVRGWSAGLAYGVISCALLSRGLHRSGGTRLGPADRVTLARSTLVGGVTALTVDGIGGPTSFAVLVGLAAVALVLDGVDGFVARRTGTASPLGARFDMEVDAFLLLALSAAVAGRTGVWVLAIGAMRYAYVAASWLLPWMRGGLPARYWRKVVAAVQGIALVVAASGVLPVPVATVAVAGALLLLVESFGRDVGWLWRHRPAAAPVRPAPGLAAAGVG